MEHCLAYTYMSIERSVMAIAVLFRVGIDQDSRGSLSSSIINLESFIYRNLTSFILLNVRTGIQSTPTCSAKEILPARSSTTLPSTPTLFF